LRPYDLRYDRNIRNWQISEIFYDTYTSGTNKTYAYYFIGEVISLQPNPEGVQLLLQTNDSWFEDTNKQVKVLISDQTLLEDQLIRQRVFANKEFGVWKTNGVVKNIQTGEKIMVLVMSKKEAEAIAEEFKIGSTIARKVIY
ncbi:MAG: hypothetical protein GYA14_03720, partial [Ignavibacteria bacterium]|nr:hypothetical protein [Ignavibacteria bacterium]